MYNDAYSLSRAFSNRSFGQSVPTGSSLTGRYPDGESPFSSRSPFDNRAVGQHTMPLSEKNMYTEFDMSRKPVFSSGSEAPVEPMDNPVVPTLIYSTDRKDPDDIGVTSGIKARHIIIIAIVAAIAIIALLK
jgi:hypothetical protein